MKLESPKYQQIIKDILESIIADKSLHSGDSYLSEYALSEKYHTTRTTVSKAVDYLANADILYKIPKCGVYIRSTLNAELYLAQLKEHGRVVFEAGDQSIKRDRIRFFSNLEGGLKADSTKGIYEHDVCLALYKYACTYPCDFVYASAANTAELLKPSCINELLRDGLLWCAPRKKDHETIEALMEHGVQIVLMESGPWGDNISYVFSDEFTVAEKAALHLLDLGHRQIAYLYPTCNANLRRLAGIRSAYDKRGVSPDNLMVYENLETVLEINEILGTKYRPTAVLAGPWAAVIESACHCGLNIPQDISLVALDDSYELAFQDIPITAICQPIEEIVFSAAHYLQGMKSGTISAPIRYESLQSKLMFRSSVSYPVKMPRRLEPVNSIMTVK